MAFRDDVVCERPRAAVQRRRMRGEGLSSRETTQRSPSPAILANASNSSASISWPSSSSTSASRTGAALVAPNRPRARTALSCISHHGSHSEAGSNSMFSG